MKKTLLLLLTLLICSNVVMGRTLKIVKLNTETIKIGNNRICKVGSTFEETEKIIWDSPKQDMWVKAVSGLSRELMHFTREAFASKNAQTPAEYFQKINHPSVRADEMQLLEGKNKGSFPEKRIALVIGNSNYTYLSSLNNPINDASDVSEKLLNLGFDVFSLFDINYSDFDTALKKFSGSARDYDVALIYYCGHGIQYEGQNYFVPIDTRLSNADDLYNCIELEDFYSKLNRTSCSTKLVFLDACRNDAPWKGKGEQFKEQDAGGIRVVFSTGPNKFSYDGNDKRNSPFAEAFLNNIGKPSPNVLSTINNIANSLKEISSRMGLPLQEVHDFGSSFINFTFLESNNVDQEIELGYDSLTYYAEQYKKGKQLMKLGRSEAALPLLKLSANGNNMDALDALAYYYYQKDNTLAEQYARRGALLGHDGCQLWLGHILYETNRKNEALQWFIKSAEQGQGWAAYLAGAMYESGDGIPKDEKKAIYWYRISAKTTNAYARNAKEALDRMNVTVYDDYMTMVSNANIKKYLSPKELYEEGAWWKHNQKPEELAYIIASAERGYSEAQNELGNIFISSEAKVLGIYSEELSQKWLSISFKSFLKEIEDGNTTAMKEIGDMYRVGNSVVTPNIDLAEKYYRMGAEKDNNGCQLWLGQLLREKGQYEEAIKWLSKAGKNNGWAAYLVGQMYEIGEGTTVDINNAIKWYRNSANTRNFYARYARSALKRLGQPVPIADDDF